MIVRKHTIEDYKDSVERTFVYESIKRIITHTMFIKDVEDALQITFR